MRSVNHWNWQKSFFFLSCSTVRWNQPPCPLNRLAHMLRVWAASVIVRRAALRSRADPWGRPEDVGHPSAHMSPPGRSLSFWLPELLWIGEGASSSPDCKCGAHRFLFSALCIQTKRVSAFLMLNRWWDGRLKVLFDHKCLLSCLSCRSGWLCTLPAASQLGYGGAILSLQPVPPLSWRVNMD